MKDKIDRDKQYEDYDYIFDEVIDSVLIQYADFTFYLLNNVFKYYKYNHLKLLPVSLIKSHEVIMKVFWSIINDKKGIKVSNLRKEF